MPTEYERTGELRRILREKGIFWMDVPREGFKRTCFKEGEDSPYIYFDDYGWYSLVSFQASPELAAELACIMKPGERLQPPEEWILGFKEEA